ALLEVLERDLVARGWYESGGKGRALAEPSPPPELAAALPPLGLALTVLVLPGPAGVVVIVACLAAASGDLQSFGARAVSGSDAASETARDDAVERAAFEALSVA